MSEPPCAAVGGRSLGEQLLGLGCAVLALAMWTWFGVANAQFLRAHPQISPADWSTLVGVATLGLSVLAGVVIGIRQARTA
ncbi:hypothetical protein [Crossiella sp. NPDC003009]